MSTLDASLCVCGRLGKEDSSIVFYEEVSFATRIHQRIEDILLPRKNHPLTPRMLALKEPLRTFLVNPYL